MIEFSHPWVLILLLLLPALFFWYLRFGRNQEGTVQFSSSELFTNEFKSRGKIRINLLTTLRLIFIGFIITGLSGPRRVDTIQESKVEVVDIVLVIDISSSMLATDFDPNRLEAVKTTAEQFITNRDGDRIGLLVFAGETFIQCPLTVDHEVIIGLLKDVTVAEQAYDGTAIGMAVANASNRLRGSQAESKVMILLSDGSNNAGELDPLTAADLASQFGIKIYTIGAATERSVTYIPGRGRVLNEIDEQTLKQIADQTGGRYFRARDETMLKDIYSEIDALEKTEINVREYTRYEELFAWFLIPALAVGISTEALERIIFRKRT